MYRLAAIAAALVVVYPRFASADGGMATPGTWWRAWNGDPLILLSLCVLAWLYVRGLVRLWAKTGAGNRVLRWQASCYFGALAILFLALVSPLDALSEELSSVHMIQHMLLATLAPLLFVLGSPTFVLAWGLPEGRQGWGRSALTFAFRLPQESSLWQPLLVWALYAGTLWVWHHPVFYQSALRDPLMHDAQHLSFFITACLFWRLCLDPLGRRRLSPLSAVPYLFTTSLHASALGIFLTLSPRPWYGDYASRTASWGLTPLEDQQLAGLIMWMPACLIYPAVAAAMFGAWLTCQGDTTRDGERGERCRSGEGGQAWIHR